jgi:hypothetical protein
MKDIHKSKDFIEHKINLPSIEIDQEAIRFKFSDNSGTNLFWIDLFRSQQDFQRELAENIYKAFTDCIKQIRLQDEKDNCTS